MWILTNIQVCVSNSCDIKVPVEVSIVFVNDSVNKIAGISVGILMSVLGSLFTSVVL